MATAQQAGELKLQGAIDAARDPASAVTSDDAQKKLVEESKKAGVAAFTFDPDASPAEKRAQAQAVRRPSFLIPVVLLTAMDLCYRTSQTIPVARENQKA